MKQYLTPLSIIIGFTLVAAAIYVKNPDNNAGGNPSEIAVGNVSPQRAEDPLLYGNVDAETTIVEFSDFECPFCGRLHPTLKKIVDESNGKINWEYRHLPLPNHTTALEAALVSECAAKVGEPEDFWKFSDEIFTSSSARSAGYYLSVAEELGLDQNALVECVQDPDTNEIVQNDMQTARALGGGGTPFNIIVSADGTQTPVRGALPYEQWASLLNL